MEKPFKDYLMKLDVHQYLNFMLFKSSCRFRTFEMLTYNTYLIHLYDRECDGSSEFLQESRRF